MQPTVAVFLVLLLLLAPPVFAQPKPSERTMRRAQAFMTETIPRLRLSDVTFEEALASIRREWDKRHPQDSFPVALTDYRPPEDPREAAAPRISLDLKDVPFVEALRFIGELSDRKLKFVSGLVQLEQYSWIEEGWLARVHAVTPDTLAALHLKPDSSDSDLRQAFEAFGIKLEDWMKLKLLESGSKLMVFSYPERQEKIAGVLFLLGNGFHISK